MQGDGVKPNYPARADGTLILTVGPVSAGTALTAEFAEKHDRPCLVVDLAAEPSADVVRLQVFARLSPRAADDLQHSSLEWSSEDGPCPDDFLEISGKGRTV